MVLLRGLLLPAALTSCAALGLHAPPHAADARGELIGGHHAANATRTLTMAVKGHQVSAVSAGWTGKVVYSIFTSAIERYHDALLAELDTWAKGPAGEGRFVAVGGNNYPENWQAKNVLKSACEDNMRAISCKEATLLAEGAARGADWLYVIGEDNYVNTERIDKFLSDKDPDSVIAYGTVGCGKNLFCHDNDDFNQAGGFCGGGGYIISRAALQRLLADGAPALHQVYDASVWPNDMTTSCQLRKHDVVLSNVGNMFGYPISDIDEYKAMAKQDFLTIHYLTPDTMRWFHAQLHGAPYDEKKRLEKKAFTNGCANNIRGFNGAGRYNECVAKRAAREAKM
jgi:hypothetical protein